MNGIETQLFTGQLIYLDEVAPDRDAEVESRWTHDPEFMALTYADPVRPLSPAQIRKKYEALEKEANEWKNLFHFAIRAQSDQRLLGFVQLFRIEWNHSTGNLIIGIGNPYDHGHGYGSEALRLTLRYAFGELNLHRLAASTFEYNPGAIRFLERHGFRIEVCQRQAIYRDGRYWNGIKLGLLAEEWLEGTQ